VHQATHGGCGPRVAPGWNAQLLHRTKLTRKVVVDQYPGVTIASPRPGLALRARREGPEEGRVTENVKHQWNRGRLITLIEYYES
jgi:hypothetical protein